VVFVLSSSQMLSNGIQKTMGRSGNADNAIVLRQGSDAELASNVDASRVSLIKAAPGVRRATDGTPIGAGEIVLVIALELADSPGQVTNVLTRGVPDDVLKLRPEVRIVEGRPAKPGTNEVIIGKRLLGRFTNVAVGSTFELNKNRPAQIVGVFEANGSSFESEIWADVDVARAAFGRDALVSSVTVALSGHSAYDGFKTAVEQDKQLGLQVYRENEYYEKQSEGTSLFVTFMGSAIVFFFSIGAMIGAMITMYAAVSNRSREIGTLRALGFSRFQILTSFLIEASILTFLGGAVGFAASLLMTFVHFSLLNMASWSEITFSFEPTPKIMILSLITGGFMGLLGGLFPAVRAARMSPLAAMRD
jgi:putative ABC transport system permease protein